MFGARPLGFPYSKFVMCLGITTPQMAYSPKCECLELLEENEFLETPTFPGYESQFDDGPPITFETFLPHYNSDPTKDDALALLLRPVSHAPKEMGAEMGIYGPDPNLDRIEECGPYLLCIRPPNPLTSGSYIARLYHKDSGEVVIAANPPVKLYVNNNYYPTIFGLCWWRLHDRYPFHTMYNGRLVCRWGGVMAVKQLPYERGQQCLM